MIRYKDTNNIAMVMAFGDEYAYYCQEYSKLHWQIHAVDKLTVKAFKKLFGRQEQVWVGGSQNRKFFIWRFGDLWVLVHNEAGFSLEVPGDTTPHQAYLLWDEFKALVLKAVS